MRTACALHVTIERFDRWHVGAFLLSASALASVWAWVHLWGWPVPAGLGAVVCTLGAIEALRFECRRRPVHLQWDGAAWHWGEPGADQPGRRSGRVEVCIDLGAWMLLRFAAAEPASTWAPRPCHCMHLPVQRRGHEQAWHALRCAVYSPATPTDPARDATGSNHPIS